MKKPIRYIALASALLFTAAACGDDDDSSSGATTTAAAAATTAGATTTGGAATTGATTSAGPTTTAKPKDLGKVTFGGATPNAGNWAIQAGVAEKLWEQFGLQVDMTFAGSTPPLLAGLIAKSLQFTSTVYDGGISAHIQNPDVHYVAGGYSFLPYDLIVTPDITDAAQIKGKTCGASNPPNLGDGLYLQMLIDGASKGTVKYPADYNIIVAQMTAPGATGALKSGQISCLGSLPPVSQLVQEQGFKVLAQTKDLDNFKDFPFFGINALGSYMKENEEVGIAFLKGYLASIAWLYDPANKDRAIEILAKNAGMDVKTASAAYEWVDPLAGYPKDGLIADNAIPNTLAKAKQYGNPTLKDVTEEQVKDVVMLDYVKKAYAELPDDIKKKLES